MKSSKLKKKLKANDVIFPSTYMEKAGKKENVSEKQERKVEERYHRFISRSKSQLKVENPHIRSLSVNHRRYETAKSNEPSLSVAKTEDKTQKTFSIAKRMKRGCSSIEISKIYYDNLQKKLQQECETILKEQHPKQHLKSYNIQKLTGNLMLLKQRSAKKIEKIEEKAISKQSIQASSRKQVFASEMSIIDKMNTFKKEPSMKEQQKKEESFVNISLSGKSIEVSQKNLLPQNFRHHNSLMLQTNNHKSQQSKHSFFFKSHVNSMLVQALAKNQIYFFSPKFSIKYTTYFKILSLKIFMNEEKQYQVEIFFQMYNQIIFKRLFFRPSQERKGTEYRPRKGHMKKLQLIRQKLRDRVLSYFLREYDDELILQFYQELILYLQNLLMLEKSYRGLVLIEAQENILQLKNHDRIFEMLKINKSFHFILKLNYTFYLVKVIFSPQMDIKFTFIYDFTTHNTGDQLYFSHPAPRKLKENKNQSQIYKIFLRVIQEFTESIAAEWKCQYATNKEIEQKESSAKISQITTCSIEKWDGVDVHKINNINKSYYLIGELTNFFGFHDQFDYGFFNTPHHIFVNGQYSYSLDEIEKHVPVYVYPHTYIYLQLTQIQKEMLVIPHVSESMDQKNAKTYINRFFQRQISKNIKKQHEYFIAIINQQQVRMRQREDLLDIYIHSLRNLRCYKLTTPVFSFPSYTESQQERLDLKKASSCIQKFIKGYTIQKSFLYSKLIKKKQSKLVIYYKGIQKLQGHFAFLTLYGLPLHQIVEFKIFMFRIGREFIIRFQSIEWLSQVNLKELIVNLLELIKTIYFKKLIQQQARKSKKRRMESLENFLKKHGKSYVNQIRSKKKLDDQVKRRMLKLATLKENKINTLVYQNIKTDEFTSPNGKEFLVTIRYVPSQQFREQNEWKSENIQICVHKQGCLNYFKLVSSMRDLVHSVSQGKISLQQIDFRQAHLFFKEIRNRIMEIVKTSHSNMGFIINRLKHFLISNYQLAPALVSPFKYKLIHNIFYETKDRVDSSDEIKSQISIQFEMQKQVQVNSNSNLIFLPYLGSQQKQQISSHFSFICKKPVSHPYHIYVDQQYIIEIIDIFRNNQDYKCLKEYNVSNRQVWITDRETGCRSILSQWENGFLSLVNFGQFNRRLFRRLIKALRPSL